MGGAGRLGERGRPPSRRSERRFTEWSGLPRSFYLHAPARCDLVPARVSRHAQHPLRERPPGARKDESVTLNGSPPGAGRAISWTVRPSPRLVNDERGGSPQTIQAFSEFCLTERLGQSRQVGRHALTLSVARDNQDFDFGVF